MSTIYSDAAGNKYLGDCLWGNHDINYPTTNWLKSVALNADVSNWWADMAAVLPTVGYASYYSKGEWTTIQSRNPILVVQFPGVGSSVGWYEGAFGSAVRFYPAFGASTSRIIGTETLSTRILERYDYSCCFSPNCFMSLMWTYNPAGYLDALFDPNGATYPVFSLFCILQNVNTNYSYYTSPNIGICLAGNLHGTSISVIPTAGTNSFCHYILGSPKGLLQSDRAVYTISCSDGQTPGAQWATDMWVYDNNAALGYPVIGRVPNMLLGIGNYTYLKPVKIQGSVFPDNGSPWYLPVGTFAEKVLLMRCYSSMP